MINLIHKMEHETIQFSSTNVNQVNHYAVVLKKCSIEDIKKNRIKGRHSLLLNMFMAGNSPVSGEYFKVRFEKYKIIEELVENTPISYYKSKFIIIEETENKVNSIILDTYGWNLA